MVRPTKGITWFRVTWKDYSGNEKTENALLGFRVPYLSLESYLLHLLTSLNLLAAKGVCQVVSDSIYPWRVWVKNPEIRRSISHSVGQVRLGWCAAQNRPLPLISLFPRHAD
jgi:hypothetical protein